MSQEDVRAIEHAGDAVTHDLIQLLNTQYVTPFDREDIYELATTIDDVIDHIEEVCDRLELYGMETKTRHAIERPGSWPVPSGISRPRWPAEGPARDQEPLVKVKRLEDEGDRVVRDAIAALFREPGSTR